MQLRQFERKPIEKLPPRRGFFASRHQCWPFVLHDRLCGDEQLVPKLLSRSIRQCGSAAIENAHQIGLRLEQPVGLFAVLPHRNRDEGEQHRVDDPHDSEDEPRDIVVNVPQPVR